MVVLNKRPEVKPGYFVRESIEEKDSNKNIIVFIHGVLGDYKETWLNEKNKAFWPEIVQNDCRFDNFDIYVASYYSPLLKGAQTIAQLGEDLRSDLIGVIRN